MVLFIRHLNRRIKLNYRFSHQRIPWHQKCPSLGSKPGRTYIENNEGSPSRRERMWRKSPLAPVLPPKRLLHISQSKPVIPDSKLEVYWYINVNRRMRMVCERLISPSILIHFRWQIGSCDCNISVSLVIWPLQKSRIVAYMSDLHS